jgi:hypothetical protein
MTDSIINTIFCDFCVCDILRKNVVRLFLGEKKKVREEEQICVKDGGVICNLDI